METGLSVFLDLLLGSFKWGVDGSGLMWFQLIVTLIAFYFTVRKDHAKSRQFVRIMFIISFWGALYGVTLTLLATANPALPAEQSSALLNSGLAASLQPLFFAVFGWFVVSVLEVFIGQPKTPA